MNLEKQSGLKIDTVSGGNVAAEVRGDQFGGNKIKEQIINFFILNPKSQEPKDTIKEEKKETEEKNVSKSQALEDISRIYNSLRRDIKNIFLAYNSLRRDMYNFLFILFIITSIIFASVSLYFMATVDVNDRLFDIFSSSMIVFFLLIGYHYLFKFSLPHLQKNSLYKKITITIVSDILFFVLIVSFLFF